MRLLREINEEVNVITEGVDKDKAYFIAGPFLQGDITNKNKRRYPMEHLRPEVGRYIREYVDRKRAFGELGHPTGPTINLDRVSHMIVSLKEEGANFIGKAKITTNTPMGSIVKSLIDEGARLGVSSRGLGSLKTNNEGVNEVQNDFHLATAGDIVADPSAPDAFVDAIMENREWMNVDGIWTPQDSETTKKKIHHTPGPQLEAVMMEAFESFLSRL